MLVFSCFSFMNFLKKRFIILNKNQSNVFFVLHCFICHIREIQTIEHPIIDTQSFDLFYYKLENKDKWFKEILKVLKSNSHIFLIFDDIGNVSILNGLMNIAFHKGSSIIILNIPFPSIRRHSMFFAEALLFEIP